MPKSRSLWHRFDALYSSPFATVPATKLPQLSTPHLPDAPGIEKVSRFNGKLTCRLRKLLQTFRKSFFDDYRCWKQHPEQPLHEYPHEGPAHTILGWHFWRNRVDNWQEVPPRQ
jgi:hypothetical protein